MTKEEQAKKLAFDNLKEHLSWMVREKMIKQFAMDDQPGLPHITVSVVPCTDCGDNKSKNISTEKL